MEGESEEDFLKRMHLNEPEPVHNWFELTYSSYLVIPRSVLQRMPQPWQRKFIDLVEEIEETLELPGLPSQYWVRATDGGKFIENPYKEYRRPIKINYKNAAKK